MCNESNVFILFHFYGGAMVFLGGAGAHASPSLAPPMISNEEEKPNPHLRVCVKCGAEVK